MTLCNCNEIPLFQLWNSTFFCTVAEFLYANVKLLAYVTPLVYHN